MAICAACAMTSAKYATQFAPPEIGDIKAFVDWSLTQVDWAAVHAFIVSQRPDADADAS